MKIARCREKTKLAAALNGHSAIWPEAEIRFEDDKHLIGWAVFYRNGERVWSCNPMYAHANFDIVEVPE